MFLNYSLIHYQYGKQPTYGAMAERMIPGIPSTSVIPVYI